VPARSPFKNALLLVGFGTCLALLTVEIAVRVATNSLFTWGGKEASDGLATDPMLGRVIVKTGMRRHPTKGFTISIGEHGIRLNGAAPAARERPLTLAVGDSFAFGDGVDDEDAWPAVLERLTGNRVVNAGMIGFGLDQAVLRAEQLNKIYSPDTIIVAFIPHDVLRCEMSYWSGFSKPYFDVDASGLRLHLAEVPSPSLLDPIKRLLTLSMTLDHLFPAFLHWQGPRELRVHERGEEVACFLMERLRKLGADVRIVVVAYPQEPTSDPADEAIKNGVVACAQANELLILDLFPMIRSLSLEQREQLFDRHFTVKGNHLVASELADFLARTPHADSEAGARVVAGISAGLPPVDVP
jgi:hypothetical protein